MLLEQLSPESPPRNQKSGGDENAVPHPKFNLMEETFGKKWVKKSDDNYFSPADCTEGNLKFHLIQLDLQVCNCYMNWIFRVCQQESTATGPPVCHSAYKAKISAPTSTHNYSLSTGRSPNSRSL
jgi:hypothetical protein